MFIRLLLPLFFLLGCEQKVCMETAKVKTILAVEYREALIELDNGTQLKLYQATVRPGDTICLKQR